MTTDLILNNTPDFSTPTKTAKTIDYAYNAMQVLKTAIESEIDAYNPDNFSDVDKAKKARADLNASAKKINDLRLSYEKNYMQAFDNFKSLANETKKIIETAAAKLDKIVKAAEEKEKETKRAEIVAYWNETKFDLIPIEKIFVSKWLNKTAKLFEIKKEIDAIQEKIYADLKTLEAFPDCETAKAFYLETLDIGGAIAKAKELQAAKERAGLEAKARAEREHAEQMQQQHREEIREFARAEKEQEIENLAAAALHEQPKEIDPVLTFTCIFKGKASLLRQLKQYMTQLGIEYTKVE